MAPVQANASVAATGLGIRYVGEHCYAYSGSITMTNSATEYTALEFTTTGSGYIKGVVDFRNVTLNTNVNTTAKWYLNDLLIFQVEAESSETALPGHNGLIIIPPSTKFKMTVQGEGSGIITLGTLTGRVYGAE